MTPHHFLAVRVHLRRFPNFQFCTKECGKNTQKKTQQAVLSHLSQIIVRTRPNQRKFDQPTWVAEWVAIPHPPPPTALGQAVDAMADMQQRRGDSTSTSLPVPTPNGSHRMPRRRTMPASLRPRRCRGGDGVWGGGGAVQRSARYISEFTNPTFAITNTIISIYLYPKISLRVSPSWRSVLYTVRNIHNILQKRTDDFCVRCSVFLENFWTLLCDFTDYLLSLWEIQDLTPTQKTHTVNYNRLSVK